MFFGMKAMQTHQGFCYSCLKRYFYLVFTTEFVVFIIKVMGSVKSSGYTAANINVILAPTFL